MTTFVRTATRFWESEDSAESIINQYRGEETNRKSKFAKQETLVKKGDKKSSKSVSRTSLLAVPKKTLNVGLQQDVSRVKKSALLYEITDRTNRLARPKTPAILNGSSTIRQGLSSRVSLPTASHTPLRNVSERFSELSRPKTFYNSATKTPGYIAPSALRAVATQRILELAIPRKTRSPRSPKRKNYDAVFQAPCSSRITYLATPKYSVKYKEAQKNFLKRSTRTQIHPPPWEFPGTRVWKELGYSKNVAKKCKTEYKRKGKPKTRARLVKTSRSDESVFSLTMRSGTVEKSRRNRKGKFFAKINRGRRIKSSKFV